MIDFTYQIQTLTDLKQNILLQLLKS